MAEWFKVSDLKSELLGTATWVRIPSHPKNVTRCGILVKKKGKEYKLWVYLKSKLNNLYKI